VQTIRQLHKAYSQLFADLVYLELDTFCSSLVDLVSLSSRSNRLLDGKVVKFVGSSLSHVCDLVKNHFASASNDDKVSVSFMSGPAREIIASAGNVARAFVAHVDMGLLPPHSGGGAPPTASAAAHAGCGAPPPPPAAALSRKKNSARGGAAPAAATGKRARTQEVDAPAAKGSAIAVTVDGDVVRTR
jgi:hypothetical protein